MTPSIDSLLPILALSVLAPVQQAPGVVELRIPMRDGVELLADAYFPEAGEPFPTILVRTPYGRRSERPGIYPERGYAFVVQACRGKDGSGGEWWPAASEREDGSDTLEWISKQPWSNGRVGMIGGSYLGKVQWYAAASGHPALRCIVPVVSSGEPFFDVPIDHGVPVLAMVRWLYSTRGTRLDSTPPPGADPAAWRTLPLSALDEAWAGVTLPYWDSILTVERPSEMSGTAFLDDAAGQSVPVFHVSGWFDGHLGGTLRNWAHQRSRGRTDQWLVIGPWPHNVNRSRRFADVDYGPDALIELEELQLQWFDHWLDVQELDLASRPRVRVFATGANEWLELDDFPPTRARSLVYHLAGGSEPDGGRGEFLSELGAEPSSMSFTYDPEQASAGFAVYMEQTTRLWFSPEDGDALVFQTEPLSEALTVVGPVSLALSFSSSAEDTDLFALLVDVAPDGVARALHYPGKIRTRYRDGWETPRALVPGHIDDVRIDVRGVAHRFEEGHRIALAIRSEWLPYFARHTNTMESSAEARSPVVARQTIHGGGEHPSTLHLWVLPQEPAGGK